jgi:hypothetical protein
LRNTSGSFHHENFITPSKDPGADPISKGGADGGAVGRVSPDFRRKKQGAAGITTAAPYITG